LDFAGQAVLIDPFFTSNPAFVSDKAAAIVLTHGTAIMSATRSILRSPTALS